MLTHALSDGALSFEVSVHEVASDAPVVLFAVGSGGQPARHATLLGALADGGCTVVAPHFERLPSPYPNEEQLTLRARRLSLALDAFATHGRTATAVGHSIGAATLLALAGAQMWLGPGRRLDIAPDPRLTRLALLAPPTGFFQAPGALDAVRVPVLAWVGDADALTPRAQTEWLVRSLPDSHTAELRVTAGAGHFSFMDEPPPHALEPMPNKAAFLDEHARDVHRFLSR